MTGNRPRCATCGSPAVMLVSPDNRSERNERRWFCAAHDPGKQDEGLGLEVAIDAAVESLIGSVRAYRAAFLDAARSEDELALHPTGAKQFLAYRRSRNTVEDMRAALFAKLGAYDEAVDAYRSHDDRLVGPED